MLVSAEPTATFAFKVHYPDYAPSPDCSVVANATHDLGEFLVRFRADHSEKAPSAGPLPSYYRRVAYHQPCHLKAQQIDNPGLELLREIPGLEVVDLAAGCCGMAGTFGMKADTYELSMLTGRPLFDRIAEVAPDLVAQRVQHLPYADSPGNRPHHSAPRHPAGQGVRGVETLPRHLSQNRVPPLAQFSRE